MWTFYDDLCKCYLRQLIIWRAHVLGSLIQCFQQLACLDMNLNDNSKFYNFETLKIHLTITHILRFYLFHVLLFFQAKTYFSTKTLRTNYLGAKEEGCGWQESKVSVAKRLLCPLSGISTQIYWICIYN